ncbi:MAG: hypothetical protein ACYS0G_08770 [Planctomycetota bacterium]|jgi:hypothetical protein
MADGTPRHNGWWAKGRAATRAAARGQSSWGTLLESEILERAARRIRLRGRLTPPAARTGLPGALLGRPEPAPLRRRSVA